jgi:hypothetical protein
MARIGRRKDYKIRLFFPWIHPPRVSVFANWLQNKELGFFGIEKQKGNRWHKTSRLNKLIISAKKFRLCHVFFLKRKNSELSGVFSDLGLHTPTQL